MGIRCWFRLLAHARSGRSAPACTGGVLLYGCTKALHEFRTDPSQIVLTQVSWRPCIALIPVLWLLGLLHQRCVGAAGPCGEKSTAVEHLLCSSAGDGAPARWNRSQPRLEFGSCHLPLTMCPKSSVPFTTIVPSSVFPEDSSAYWLCISSWVGPVFPGRFPGWTDFTGHNQSH